MTEYRKNVEGLLEIVEKKEDSIQAFNLTQINEMIENTLKQKELKEQELVFINNSLVELDKIKKKAVELEITE